MTRQETIQHQGFSFSTQGECAECGDTENLTCDTKEGRYLCYFCDLEDQHKEEA